jgi:hypothetical protein
LNYARYVAPLLPQLKKGNKWKWNNELQKVFENLRLQSANSIHLIHPDENLPYTIYTDASGRALAAVLMQTDRNGETRIVSTASRVLKPTEQRYSVTEQELLAIVYALGKFRIYVYGHEIQLHSDNKAPSFLGKCSLTSNRVARWVMMLEEFNLNIKHISGAKHFLADTLSRHTAGLSEKEIKELTQPREIVVAAVNLNIDSSVCSQLKNLAMYQARDPKICELIAALREQRLRRDRFMMPKDILHTKDNNNYPYWRPVLPTELEEQVISFVHTALGHLGTEKCMSQIAHTFCVKNLGRKVRRFVSSCDVCQRIKPKS